MVFLSSSLYRVETTCHQDHPLNVVRHLARCSVGSIVGIGGWHSDLFFCKKSDLGHIFLSALIRIFSDGQKKSERPSLKVIEYRE